MAELSDKMENNIINLRGDMSKLSERIAIVETKQQ